MERFKGQHTLGNAPVILVQGAIVAANAILITSRISGTSVSLIEDTPFSNLDEALNEMSVSWKLASDARAGLRKALSSRQPEQSAQIVSRGGTIGQFNDPLETFQWTQVVGPEFINFAGDPLHEVNFENPDQYSWKPMSFMGVDTLS